MLIHFSVKCAILILSHIIKRKEVIHDGQDANRSRVQRSRRMEASNTQASLQRARQWTQFRSNPTYGQVQNTEKRRCFQAMLPKLADHFHPCHTRNRPPQSNPMEVEQVFFSKQILHLKKIELTNLSRRKNRGHKSCTLKKSRSQISVGEKTE